MALICPESPLHQVQGGAMGVARLTGPAEAFNVHYLRKSVSTYLSGQEDWKFVMGVILECGLDRKEVHDILKPLKGSGWKFRSQALFDWLERP